MKTQVASASTNGHKLEYQINASHKPIGFSGMRLHRGDVESLAGILPVSSAGRFYRLKLDIQREINRTKPGQFFYLPVIALKDNQKERLALIVNVTGFFKKQQLPWVIKWTSVKNAFLIVRRADYEKARGSR